MSATTPQLDLALMAGLIGGIDGLTDRLRENHEQLAAGLSPDAEQHLSDLIAAAEQLVATAEALEAEAASQRRQLKQQEAGR